MYVTCSASVTSVQYKSVVVFRVTMDFLKMSMTKHGSTGHHSTLLRKNEMYSGHFSFAQSIA